MKKVLLIGLVLAVVAILVARRRAQGGESIGDVTIDLADAATSAAESVADETAEFVEAASS